MKFRCLLLFLFAGFALGLAPPSFAQSKSGPFVINSSTSQCATIQVTANSTVGIDVSGTFSITLQPKVSINGGTARNTQVYISTSSTPQSTITTVGAYTSAVGGFDEFLVCVGSYSSGSATVNLTATPAVNAGVLGNGGNVDAQTVNGAAVPASASLVGTNGSGQLVQQLTPVVTSLSTTGASGGYVSVSDTSAGNNFITTNPTPTVTGASTTVALSTGTPPTNVGSVWTYTLAATESGAGSNAWVGASVTTTGWTGGATGNNGTFTITASTTTTVSWTNGSGTATNTGTPVMISSAVVSSPLVKIASTINSGTAGTLNSIPDYWTLQDVPGSVVPNPTSILTLAHTGSTGQAIVRVPYLNLGTNTAVGGSYSNEFDLYSTNNGTNRLLALSAAGVQVPSGSTFEWYSNATTIGGSVDTTICRAAAGIVEIGTTTCNTSGILKAAAYMSVGTTFTTNNGCGESTNLIGGATAGKITTAASTGCSFIVTMGNSATAPNGWSCTAIDLTTSGDVTNPHQTATAATTATFASGTIVAGDVIQFSCIGY